MTDLSTQSLIDGSREFLRDFPIFFETDVGMVDVTTVRLPHPLILSSSIQAVTFDAPTTPVAIPAEAIQVDERNGLLKFLDTSYLGKRVMINGYHFSWFLDGDLAFHAGRTLVDVSYGQSNTDMSSFTPIEIDTVIMGTVVSALWSLATELALDIDVSTPEGMYIPARQRYTQVIQMWQQWAQAFHDRMEALNLGVGKLEIFWLRRVAYLTNRLVPLYKEREIDDRRPPQRLYPPIPMGEAALDETPERVTMEEIGRGGQDLGWQTIGTSGAPNQWAGGQG